MAGRVLLINHGTALMTEALLSGLRAAGIQGVQTEAEIGKIDAERAGTDVFLLFAGDYIYESPELLVYLRDLCVSEEKALCVVGYAKEITEIEETIPKNAIAHEFKRPVDVKGLTVALSALISDGGRSREKHILLVDDDVMFLQMMQSWLAPKYSVTAVKSGMQAITYIAAHTPDLILLDYDMPITPGTQVLEMIKSEPNSAKIPVIFLTGKSDRSSVESAVRLRPDGYLLKSMEREAILEAVDNYFASRRWNDLYS